MIISFSLPKKQSKGIFPQIKKTTKFAEVVTNQETIFVHRGNHRKLNLVQKPCLSFTFQEYVLNKLNYLMFLNCFDVFMSKNNFLKIKK
jgi:hypothetical protein